MDRSGTDRRIREYLRRGRSDQRTRIVDGGRIDLHACRPSGSATWAPGIVVVPELVDRSAVSQ